MLLRDKMENTTATAHPPVATRSEWLAKRLELLEKEKALTKTYDAINAERRRLPMVRLEKSYTFKTVDGETSLLDLFGDMPQLIVQHFMFDPAWDKGCPGCTSSVNAMGDLSDLEKRSTKFVLVSRAPLEKLLAYKAEMGWDVEWVSSGETTFNRDFFVTLEPEQETLSYNFKSKEETLARFGPIDKPIELSGLSVFFRVGDEVFHTYSTYGRGAESLVHSYALLDITPYGRQEDFEDSPAGWPQKPTYG